MVTPRGIMSFIGPPKPKPNVPGVVTGAQLVENLGTSDDNVLLNTLSNKFLRDIELKEATKNKVKPKIQEEEPVDIFAKDIYQGEVPETNFTLDQVPPSLQKIDKVTGEVQIKVGNKFYPADQVILQQDFGPKQNKYFTLKYKKPTTPGEFLNLGVRLADNPSIQKAMNDYIDGNITKSQLGLTLSKIGNMPNFITYQKKAGNTYLGLNRPGQKINPFIEGYFSTLKKTPENIEFNNFINKNNTGGKKVEFRKSNQAVKVMKKLENDAFNKIKFPDGTTMAEQPLGVRMYNAYISDPDLAAMEGKRSDIAGYAHFIRTYVNPYFNFKNPDKVLPDFNKGTKTAKLEGTNLIYNTAKGERVYKIPDEYKPYFNEIRKRMAEVIPEGQRGLAGATYQSHLSRMIGKAKEDGADPSEIIKVIQSIDAEGLANLFLRKKELESQVRKIRDEALSPMIKKTNPELFVDQTNKSNTGFDISLIEISHIEDIADNWRAAFDLNNIFLAPGKFNRDQLIFDKKIKSLLNKFSKAKNFSQKKSIIKDLKKIEEKLISKNLISKHGDRYFGADIDQINEANLLKTIQEQVDYTRYLADGGLVSFEEVLEYDND